MPPPEPKASVAVDLGSTTSGIAYTLPRRDQFKLADVNVSAFTASHDYPDSSIAFFNYSKTATALYYGKPGDEPLWGWPAYLASLKEQGRRPGQFQSSAIKSNIIASDQGDAQGTLPDGITHSDVPVHYMRALGKYAVDLLVRNGIPATTRDVKWCFSGPSTWTPAQRAKIVEAATTAGLVASKTAPDNGGSQHDAKVVADSEAAAYFCLSVLKFEKAVAAL